MRSRPAWRNAGSASRTRNAAMSPSVESVAAVIRKVTTFAVSACRVIQPAPTASRKPYRNVTVHADWTMKPTNAPMISSICAVARSRLGRSSSIAVRG